MQRFGHFFVAFAKTIVVLHRHTGKFPLQLLAMSGIRMRFVLAYRRLERKNRGRGQPSGSGTPAVVASQSRPFCFLNLKFHVNLVLSNFLVSRGRISCEGL